jgi:septum formation protein
MATTLKDTMENFPFTLILGSKSPRRKELITQLGFDYIVWEPQVDEDFPVGLRAQQIPEYLCEKKADAYDKVLKDTEILITADTIVWCEDKVLNKPKNFEEGKKMLNTLSGKMHEVYTAVCLKSGSKQTTFFDVTKVYFKKLKDEEIEYYLTNFNAYDKAGGYGVQEWIGYIAIDKMEGSFYNVMGLPIKDLYEELMKF